MTKSNRTKHWQLNLIVDYNDKTCAISYRFNIIELLKHLASIYRLDYALSVEHQFSFDTDSSEQFSGKNIFDLVYFRTNENSRIEKKDFRSTLDCMFCKVPSPFREGVEICTQLYKFLNKFPFPTDFYRPLNYPWIEHHEGSHKTLLIYSEFVAEVTEEEQDFCLN